MKPTYYFCNASVRVAECRVNPNLCCLTCEHNEDCKKIAGRVKPCQACDFGDDEICDFMI